MKQQKERVIGTLALILCSTLGTSSTTVFADAVPGGTLDPHSIPKYVTPLVIPPVMNTDGAADKYDIAVRQFRQQILPGGVWASLSPACSVDPRCDLPATTVWGYGPDADLTPAVAPDSGSQFNYPGYTIETTSHIPVRVRWINALVADPDGCKSAVDPSSDPACNFIPPLLPVDQTLHWANPPATGCRDGSNRSDCATNNPASYAGPVPIVTHLHGAHVETHSDGYPEAWWLPAANNIPGGYATRGELFDDATGKNPGNLGYADYRYRNDQPATTLWYHDHALGITHTTVYAGLAGFWLIRRGRFDKVWDRVRRRPGTLPGPAPVAGEGVLELNDPHSPVRRSIREIPMVIQDRSFNADGSLFYPDNRAFFEGLEADTLRIPFVPESDIAPIWNPEAFFNTIVVNGVTWPALEVAPARYRFRLLNGCNSRTLNLAMFEVNGDGSLGAEIPFYEIGGDQGFLRRVVRIETGLATPLRGNGALPPLVPASDPQQALLLAPAERADVIVDFAGLPDGTRVRMVNTAPDAPYQGFPDEPADPDTTGQVMELVVSFRAEVAAGRPDELAGGSGAWGRAAKPRLGQQDA